MRENRVKDQVRQTFKSGTKVTNDIEKVSIYPLFNSGVKITNSTDYLYKHKLKCPEPGSLAKEIHPSSPPMQTFSYSPPSHLFRLKPATQTFEANVD